MKPLTLTLAALLSASLAVAAPAGRPRASREELRVEPKAGLPEVTIHFTVEAYGTRAAKTAQLLESTYLDFIDVTGLSNVTLPRKIRVIIFENAKEFRMKVPGGRGKNAVAKDGKLITFEQDRIERILIANAAGLLFDEYLGRKAATEERWLRRGIIEGVISRRNGADPQDARDHWKGAVRRDRPASLGQMLGKESRDADDADGAAAPASKKKARATGARHQQASAASLVAFLGSWGGRLNLAYLLAELRAQRTLDQALAKAYPGKFRNFEELFNFWLVDEIGETESKDARKPVQNRK